MYSDQFCHWSYGSFINPEFPEMIKTKLLPQKTHTLSSKQVMRILKLISRSCYLDLPYSHNQFTRKRVEAGGEN